MVREPGASGTGPERQGMPPGARLALLAGLAAILTGALYLIAVRGEALLTDLSALSQRILLCF